MQNSALIRLLLPVALWGLLATAAGASEPNRGAILSASCEGCHGPGGHSPGAIPGISGQSAQYIRTALEQYRSGERPSTVMARHAKGYTREEVEQIAKYFEEQD